MKTKITLLLLGGTLSLLTPSLRAQITNSNSHPFLLTNTNSPALNGNLSYQPDLAHERTLGERSMLPAGLKQKMKLTLAQRTELKPIEDEFAKTCKLYRTANQSRIDAAQEAAQKARLSKDPARIQLARLRLQNIWVGLQRDRESAVQQIKRHLTPEQLKILEDPTNQWRENQADEVNDPSAN